jgi:hypothetical protein
MHLRGTFFVCIIPLRSLRLPLAAFAVAFLPKKPQRSQSLFAEDAKEKPIHLCLFSYNKLVGLK